MGIMDDLLKTAVTQAPGLAVLCYLVVTFLKRDRDRDQFIRELHNEHLAARGESRDAINENTQSNREVTAAVHSLQSSLNRKP